MAATLEEAIARVVEETVRRVLREERAATGPEVLSTEQAAELAGVSAKTVRAWIAEGLPAGKRGRLRTILRADLDRWLAGERQPSREDAILRSVG